MGGGASKTAGEDLSKKEISETTNNGRVDNSYGLVNIHVSIVTSLTLGVLMMFVCISVCLIIKLWLCTEFCHTMCGTCCGKCLEAQGIPDACVTGQISFRKLFENPPGARLSLAAEREQLSPAPGKPGQTPLQLYPTLQPEYSK